MDEMRSELYPQVYLPVMVTKPRLYQRPKFKFHPEFKHLPVNCLSLSLPEP